MKREDYETENKESNKKDFPIFFQILLSECFKENSNSLLILPENFKINSFISYLILYFRSKDIQKVAFILLDQDEKIKFKDLIDEKNVPFITSMISVNKRTKIYRSVDIFFVTAQIMSNDLLRETLKAGEIEVAVFLQAEKSNRNNHYSKLAKILRSNSKIKFIGISKPNFRNKQELIAVIKSLKVTNLFYKSNYYSIIQNCLEEKSKRKIVVPLSQELNQIKVNLRTLEGRVNSVLREMGIENPYYLRKNFSNQIESLKTRNYKEETIKQIINLAKESIFLQSLIENIESFGAHLSLELIEKNLEKIAHFSFSSALFEIYVELKELKNENHPKIGKLVEEIEKVLNTHQYSLNSENPTILVYSNRRANLQSIAEYLILKGIENFVILPTQMKKQLVELERLDKKEFQIVLTSKNIPLTTDYTFIYSLPKQKTLFLELIQRPNSKCLITHRSLEEKIFYKWREEKNSQLIDELISEKEVREALLFNQQELFNQKMMKMINPRTKDLIIVNSFFEKNKKERIKLEENSLEENPDTKAIHDLSLIRFLSGCSNKEALLIIKLKENSQIKNFENLTVDDLTPFFSEHRAKEIIFKIKNRANLVSKV